MLHILELYVLGCWLIVITANTQLVQVRNVESRVAGRAASSLCSCSCTCTLTELCNKNGAGKLDIDETIKCKNNHLVCCKSTKKIQAIPYAMNKTVIHGEILEIPEYTDYTDVFGGTESTSEITFSIDELTSETLDNEISSSKCGVASPKLDWKRQNPKDVADFGEFPWTLLLFYNPDKILVHCGATLVDVKVAVTAAHCVYRRNTSEIIVRAGEWDISDDWEDVPHQDRRIKEVVIHPGFDNTSLVNDIAVLYLDTNFELQNHIKKLCLPYNETVNTTCVATGWGIGESHESTEQQAIMKKSVLELIPPELCQRKLGNNIRLSQTQMCARREGVNTTVGDRGSALFCSAISEPMRFIFTGINSWGKDKDKNAPGVYTKVSQYTEWLLGMIEDSYDQ